MRAHAADALCAPLDQTLAIEWFGRDRYGQVVSINHTDVVKARFAFLQRNLHKQAIICMYEETTECLISCIQCYDASTRVAGGRPIVPLHASRPWQSPDWQA